MRFALALLLLLASCRGMSLVPTVGTAYQEDTDSYTTGVQLTFVPEEVGDPRPFRRQDEPSVGPPELARPLESLEDFLSASAREASAPEPPGDTVTIDTPMGPITVAGGSVLGLGALAWYMLRRRRRGCEEA